jgi:hypothetical protein
MNSMEEKRRCRWVSKLGNDERFNISGANARRMVSNTTTSTVGRPAQQTIRHAYISNLKKVGFEEYEEQLREWDSRC